MLGKAILLKMYEYNYWANQRLFEKAENLSKAQLFGPTSFGHGSLLGTLFHILRTECVWRSIAQEREKPSQPLQIGDFLNLEKLRTYWQKEEDLMLSFINGLSEEELAATLLVHDEGGNEQQMVLWHMLMQPIYHGIHHRSEAAAILTGYSQPPGDLDFILFV